MEQNTEHEMDKHIAGSLVDAMELEKCKLTGCSGCSCTSVRNTQLQFIDGTSHNERA